MSKFKEKTFIEKCISGDALLEEIEDYIDEWHNSQYECELHEFLGLTEYEYDIWFENNSMLVFIVEAREIKKPINDYLNNIDDYQLAARASSPDEAKNVKEWLKKTGRLK